MDCLLCMFGQNIFVLFIPFLLTHHEVIFWPSFYRKWTTNETISALEFETLDHKFPRKKRECHVNYLNKMYQFIDFIHCTYLVMCLKIWPAIIRMWSAVLLVHMTTRPRDMLKWLHFATRRNSSKGISLHAKWPTCHPARDEEFYCIPYMFYMFVVV